MTKELASFLRQLWDHVVFPVIQTLQRTHLPQTCIWWCPTAQFSTPPWHAAGPYRKGQRNLDDLCISSYTPTLTALICARERNSSDPASKVKRFIAIGQANAVGQVGLPSVGVELDAIAQHLKDRTAFMHIEGEESRISRVVELGKHVEHSDC